MTAVNGALGRDYADRELICRQGEVARSMFVVQAGRAAVIREQDGCEVLVGYLEVGDVFGEMAIIDCHPRSATVRAEGHARVLTIDKRAFLRRVHEDPSIAFRILATMSERIRSMTDEVVAFRVDQQPIPIPLARTKAAKQVC